MLVSAIVKDRKTRPPIRSSLIPVLNYRAVNAKRLAYVYNLTGGTLGIVSSLL